jgi:hypothetical protein
LAVLPCRSSLAGFCAAGARSGQTRAAPGSVNALGAIFQRTNHPLHLDFSGETRIFSKMGRRFGSFPPRHRPPTPSEHTTTKYSGTRLSAPFWAWVMNKPDICGCARPYRAMSYPPPPPPGRAAKLLLPLSSSPLSSPSSSSLPPFFSFPFFLF